MSTLPHPHAELSAYVDGALPAADRAAVEAHLDVCRACAARVADLRATAALIRSLPDPVPARRLVPRLAPPVWLAPLRTLSTLASGVATLLFVASAVVTNVGGATSAQFSNIGRNLGPVPAAAPERTTVDSAASPTPPPAALGAATASPRGAAGAPTEAQKRQDAAASPTSAPAAEAAGRDVALADRVDGRSTLGSPWLWLAVALLSGAFAYLLHRRLRAVA